jgi:cytochrome c556
MSGRSGSRPFASALLALIVAAASGGLGNAQAPGTPPPKDTIFARKILMGSIDSKMGEIETMLAPEGRLDAAEAQEHADTISIMLLAFPHLFPAETNQWKPGADRDPATDTFASPDVWANFPEFYGRATSASKIAQDAGTTRRLDDFRRLIGELRAGCNGCHERFMKTE